MSHSLNTSTAAFQLQQTNGQEQNFLDAFVIEVRFKSEHWSRFLLEELQLQAFTRAYKEL